MTVSLVKAEITPDMAGCWLGGHFGWHNAYRVVEKAHAYGFTIPSEYMDVMQNYWDHGTFTSFEETDEQWEAVHGQGGLADQATEFLQGKAPEGYEFVWDMGELSMMRTDELDENGFYDSPAAAL